MKYVVTGHTSGIGKALFEKLSPNVKGYSKSNGFDINNKQNRNSIIQRNLDADVFINCAEDKFGQSQLLLDLFEEFKEQEKTIINVGSRIAEMQEMQDPKYIDYWTYKTTLKTLCTNLQKIDTPLKILYVSFGYVGTDRILKKFPHFTNNDYISIDRAVEIILDAKF